MGQNYFSFDNSRILIAMPRIWAYAVKLISDSGNDARPPMLRPTFANAQSAHWNTGELTTRFCFDDLFLLSP
jgi:hypothetical protein